jgi:regulator of cell morphogenesis and NO signaling
MNTAKAQSDPRADWQSQPLGAVVDFILTRFHEPLRRDLPDLVARARQLEGSPGEDRPVGLASHLEQVRLAVESHLVKEEKILFPLIAAGRGTNALMPIRVMMAEHDDHAQNLRRTRELTGDFTLPAGASAAWRDLYRDLERLESDLAEHIDLENNVLFTRALESR